MEMSETRGITQTKRLLTQLIKAPLDKPFVFTVPLGDGEAVVQRIRVELSRIRKRMEALGKDYIEFKVKKTIKPNLIDQVDEVTLLRTKSLANAISEDMALMMRSLELKNGVS